MKVKYLHRTKTEGGTVAWKGDVRDIEPTDFDANLHEQVDASTAVDPPRDYDSHPVAPGDA